MTKRRSLSKLARVRIFDRAGGLCHLCGLRIHVGEPWDVEHVNPLWLSSDDSEENMRPAHKACHRAKTSAEAPLKAKSDRVRAKHLGIKPKSRFPCSKESPFRKKLNGEVVRRGS
jgi:5-methylcytosine-specific restriction protein A